MERTLGSATVSNIRSSSTAHRSLVGTVRLWQRRIIGRANQKIATLRNQKKPGTPYRTRRIGK